MTQTTQIDGVEVHEVVVPARAGSTDSPSLGQFMDGVPWDRLPICLIELHLSDGITALGEVCRGNAISDLQPFLKLLPGTKIAGPGLGGGLPAAFRAKPYHGLLAAHAPALWQSPTSLIGAIEIALLDWAGQRLGCRVVDLLGGAYREQVPVEYWCGRQTPADLARLVTRARELGFGGLKMKSRIGDPVVEQVRAIRDAGGDDFRLTIDPMFQWLGPREALLTLRRLEPLLDGLKIEDPFPQDRPDYWRRARGACAIPLIWHARTIDSLRRAMQERCADDFNCSGGMWEVMTQFHAVEIAGHSCWHGSAIEMGIGQIAHLHAAAASRCCVIPSDFVSGLIREHTLVNYPWTYQNGHLPLPQSPGLGIRLDRDALVHYRTNHAQFRA